MPPEFAPSLQRLRQWHASTGRMPERSGTGEEKYLAQWANGVRKRHRKKELPTDCVRALEEWSSWTWHARDTAWDATFAQLQQWLQEHDNTFPSKRTHASAAELRLAKFVDRERRALGSSNLAEKARVR